MALHLCVFFVGGIHHFNSNRFRQLPEETQRCGDADPQRFNDTSRLQPTRDPILIPRSGRNADITDCPLCASARVVGWVALHLCADSSMDQTVAFRVICRSIGSEGGFAGRSDESSDLAVVLDAGRGLDA